MSRGPKIPADLSFALVALHDSDWAQTPRHGGLSLSFRAGTSRRHTRNPKFAKEDLVFQGRNTLHALAMSERARVGGTCFDVPDRFRNRDSYPMGSDEVG